MRYIDSNLPPWANFEVPGGGSMFDRYTLNAVFAEADEVISIAKMKNHAFMGVTLTIKKSFRSATDDSAGGTDPIVLPSPDPSVLYTARSCIDYPTLPQYR